MHPYNVEIFEEIFNWREISDLNEKIIKELSKKMNISIEPNFSFKSTWGYYKKFSIYDKKEHPILFLKYVRDNYPEEVLGLHITRYFLDPELGFTEYFTGLMGRKRKKIPYLLTTFENGDHIGNYDISDFKFQFGRLTYLHEVLSLYDVEDRHFIVRDGKSVCRIDFGRSFEHPERPYVGFKEYLSHKHFDTSDPDYKSGYQYEKQLVQKNTQGKRTEIISMMRKFKTLYKDYEVVFKDMGRIINRIIDHWNRIGFLEECGLTECQWI